MAKIKTIRELEKMFTPNVGKLIVKKKNDEMSITCKIVDAELDAIKCTFNGDDCVEIDTKDLTYITLTTDHLFNLIDLIEEAETKLNNFYDKILKK